MDPVSFAVGLASLTGVFTACVGCFEYIQLGRNFEKDYGKNVLKLDLARLQMTRWGASLGIGAESEKIPLTASQISATSPEEFETAKELLENIKEAFAIAEKKSKDFKKDKNPDELVVWDASKDLDAQFKPLHDTIQGIALKRQKRISIGKRFAWAVYQKGKFDSMIEDITEFVDKLVVLFPAAHDNRLSLCKEEVSHIETEQDLKLLKDIAPGDKLLTDVVNRELKSRGHTFTGFDLRGHAELQAGDRNGPGVESKSHYYGNVKATDNVVMHLGNVNDYHTLQPHT
ncbi:MAG: hypothetical protein M1840_003494 [Geoglossum simile]|nr:MAG: hypothetical protein M1840_003494 [Geoglossum simile]